jgi:topoisomerase IA-like protein
VPKVKLLQGFVGSVDGNYNPKAGDVIEVSSGCAADLVRRERAVPVRTPAKKAAKKAAKKTTAAASAPEAASQKAPEAAMRPKAEPRDG